MENTNIKVYHKKTDWNKIAGSHKNGSGCQYSFSLSKHGSHF
jgi:hypothetical protein